MVKELINVNKDGHCVI